MERLCIIDHETHKVYIEDVDEDMLDNEYGGEEEEYIKANYACGASGNFSWDYIIAAEYIPLDDGNHYSYDIDFEEII